MSPVEPPPNRPTLPKRLANAVGGAIWRGVIGFLEGLGQLVEPVFRPVELALTAIADRMPKGLYARALLIVVLPMVILQAVLTYVFMERHWQLVTSRLSEALTRDIAALILVAEAYPQDSEGEMLTRIARESLNLSVGFLPDGSLPPLGPKPFLSLLDNELSNNIAQIIKRPFWIDTVGRSDLVEIRIQMKDRTLRVFARRSQTYASNWHIFIAWMVGTSSVLLIVAILFLRNQIRPMQQLAAAADSFGKGRPVEGLRIRGAREVRQATEAFFQMRRRIERQIEQRTSMLAGVSHDLRTVLTRFKLQLALMPASPEIEELARDVEEMQAMVEAYMAFARGDGDEDAQPTDIAAMLTSIGAEADRAGFEVAVSFEGPVESTVRPGAFKRCIGNLVGNACRYGEKVTAAGRHAQGWLTITVDDDGPGIPEDERENVFKPFYRLDAARNQDEGGTGLGLAIARDIARSHGGDVRLETSPMGGLRCVLRIPG